MAIKIPNRVDSTIESIEQALSTMLESLNTKLEETVKSSGAVNKDDLGDILQNIDKQIIENDSIRHYMLGDDPATQARVKQLIQDVQDAVKETINQFRDSNKGKTLTDEQYKDVMDVYDSKVTGSDTVTRSKTLDEFRTKSSSISFESTDDKFSTTSAELDQVTDKLDKLSAIKGQQKTGEDIKQTAERLSDEANELNLNGEEYYTKIEELTKTVDEGAYDFDAVAGKIAVDNFMYKNNSENCKLVSEFLTNLSKLREGNPEIENIFTELESIGVLKDGKCEIKQTLAPDIRKKLTDALNRKLISKPIDFNKAKENTIKTYYDKIDAEIETVLSIDFMNLYPEKVKAWKESLKKANEEKKPDLKDDIWKELKDFLASDLAIDILAIGDFEDEATLTTRKAELESKKKTLNARKEGEKFEKVPDEVRRIKVGDIDIESDRNLMRLSEDAMKKASKQLFEKKKAEFTEKFNKEADPKLKRVGFFERIGYAISHRTLQPKKAIMAERIESWSRTQISTAMSYENEEIARQQGARDYAYSVGALTPDQLREFRENQAKVLEQHKKKQEEAILDGTTKSADDASKKAKDDAETELGE